MVKHPGRPFTLEHLAVPAGVSRSTFAARFVEAFGQSTIDCLKQLRLQRAAQLLRATELPVKIVAMQVGYGSRSYFTRAFKARYGAEPAAYRRASVERAAEQDDSVTVVSGAVMAASGSSRPGPLQSRPGSLPE